jgi:wyosine [tRNA(Phe)-imidazoG37] synthetase (radical SAM superfamily)
MRTPSHGEVREFAKDLANRIGFSLIDESIESRVVLLSRLKAQIGFGDG